MAETSYPIADGEGVTEYAYEKLMAQVAGVGRVNLASGVGGSGVASIGNKLVYGDSTGRQVKIKPNEAFIFRGFRWESGTEVIVRPLDVNTSGKTRIDRIVLRLDRSDWTVRLATIKGTPADVPVAPQWTSNYGATGVHDVPIGRATVRSNTGSGLPSLAAADVIDESTWLAPTAHVGFSDWMNRALPAGEIYTSPDNGRMWAGLGTSEAAIVGERGPFTKLAAAGGWTADNLYAQRVNGWTFFQGYITLNVADRAPHTDMLVCTIPPLYRPVRNFFFHVGMSPGQVGFGHCEALTGRLVITAYNTAFPQNGKLIIGPLSWPSFQGD